MNRFAGLTLEPATTDSATNRFAGLSLDEPDGYWEKGLKNIPGDLPVSAWETLKDTGRGLGTLAKNILLPNRESGEMLRGLGRMGQGVGQLLVEGQLKGAGDRLPGPQPGTPGAEVLGMAENAASWFPGGEKWPENPTRFLTELAGLIGAPGQGASTLSRIGRSARFLDPVNAAGKMAQLGGRAAIGVGRKGPSVTGHMIGLATGQGPEPAMVGLRAGRMGEADAFLEGPRKQLQTGIGKPDVPGLGLETKKQLELTENALGVPVGKALDRFDQAGQKLDIAALKKEIVGDVTQGGAGGLLESMGIGVRPSPRSGSILLREGNSTTRIELIVPEDFRLRDQGVMEGALRTLLQKPDMVTARELHSIKKGFDKVRSTDDAVMARVYGLRSKVREALSAVPDYDAATGEMSRFYEELGNRDTGISKQMGFSDLEGPLAEVDAQRFGESMVRALNESASEADRVTAVHRLEEMISGSKLSSRSAGLRFTGEMPTGLVGKNEFVKLLGMAGIGGVVGGAAAGMSAALAGAGAVAMSVPVIYYAFIPKHAARTLVKLGGVQRYADQVEQFAQTAVRQAVALGINPRTMTMGRLLDRLDEERAKQEQQSAAWQSSNPMVGLGRFTAMPEPER